MKIAIGSDHGGFELKEHLVSALNGCGHAVENLGCHSLESVDYPDFAENVCQSLITGSVDLGILICGTGIGMSMAANRRSEIRAALCHDEYTARMSREHNNANILCLGARVIGIGVAEAIIETWISSSFQGGRHQQRIEKFNAFTTELP